MDSEEKELEAKGCVCYHFRRLVQDSAISVTFTCGLHGPGIVMDRHYVDAGLEQKIEDPNRTLDDPQLAWMPKTKS